MPGRVAEDDDLTVVLLRGAEGVFSTGADMNNAYGWYGARAAKPARRRRQRGPANVADSPWTANLSASITT